MAKRPFNITKESYNISTEYNAVDWPRFFLGSLNSIWRSVTNDSKIAIEHPGLLISLMTGKITDVVRLLTVDYYDMLKAGIDEFLRDKGPRGVMPNKSTLGDDINIYKILFVDYKKVNTSAIDVYERTFDAFKRVVEVLKKTECKKIQMRPASTSEIADIKLFKPEKARKEMEVAVAYFKSSDKAFGDFAEKVALWCEQNIIEYVANNISVD